MQAHISKCQPILQAEEAFASAGHPDALAVNKGHLLPTSFLAQRLATQGSNLCQESTVNWQCSTEEHSFVSLLRKLSRAGAELLRGPLHANGVPGDTRVATAVFNDVWPSRQSTQQQDKKFTVAQDLEPLGCRCAACK